VSSDTCRNCGGNLGEGQEWCLECGAARTFLPHPPDWRIPVAIVVLVLGLAAAALLIALVSL
jgi:hypothetical protein